MPTPLSRLIQNAGADPLRPYAAVEELDSGGLQALAASPLGCHAMLLLHNHRCRNRRHGLTESDFSAATVLFRLPGQAFSMDEDEACGYDSAQLLCLGGGQCARHAIRFGEHTYFRYSDSESLHISDTEHSALRGILGCMATEQRHDADESSEAIMAHLAEAALSLCQRLYARQFLLRSDSSRKTIESLHRLIDSHYAQARPLVRPTEPPSLRQLAGSLAMSEQYLDDLCRHETGLGVADHIKLRRVELARQCLAEGALTPAAIARKLGFCSAACLDSIIGKTCGPLAAASCKPC